MKVPPIIYSCASAARLCLHYSTVVRTFQVLFTHLRTFVVVHKNRGAFMSTLYESIISLCDEKGIKGGKMCVELGISKSTLTDLKNKRRSGISLETAQKIADYFGVSVDRVLGKESQTYYVGGPASFRTGLISDSVVIPDQKEKSPTGKIGEADLDDPYLIQLFEIAKQADEAGKKFLIATAKNYIESRKEK